MRIWSDKSDGAVSKGDIQGVGGAAVPSMGAGASMANARKSAFRYYRETEWIAPSGNKEDLLREDGESVKVTYSLDSFKGDKYRFPQLKGMIDNRNSGSYRMKRQSAYIRLEKSTEQSMDCFFRFAEILKCAGFCNNLRNYVEHIHVEVEWYQYNGTQFIWEKSADSSI